MSAIDDKNRCFGSKNALYAKYHDEEWGVPIFDDQKLFEMLIIEGAQAGLSFETVLKKRLGYQKAFHNFDIDRVSKMSDEELEALRDDPTIIRNRLKIYSTKLNASIFKQIQKEFGSFSKYLWQFSGNKPTINQWHNHQEVPTTTKESDIISKDLKKRGMKFVGSTIIYAYMQAIGMVDDHIQSCWKRN